MEHASPSHLKFVFIDVRVLSKINLDIYHEYPSHYNHKLKSFCCWQNQQPAELLLAGF